MNWSLFDFAVFGVILLGVGGAYAFLRRRARNSTYRYAAGAALATAFLLLWMNGAVGIIGSENNDANLMYFGVLAIAFVGSVIARFRPAGMARTMYATALAQAAVAAIAVIADLGPDSPKWPADILILTTFFATLWLVAGRLFKNASRHRYSTNDRSALYPD